MPLCGQLALEVHYNSTSQSSSTGFITGGKIPLHTSPAQLSRLLYGDVLGFQLFLLIGI